jgi:hypothetical protein
MRPCAPLLFDAPRGHSLGPVARLLLVASLVSGAGAAGCMGAQTPAAKATEVARDFNSDLRWGRTDVALKRSSPKDRSEFLKRHAGWHTTQRILDNELASLYMVDATHAVVLVDVSWLLDDDTNLRVTRLEQKWSDADGKWVLESEKRLHGAEGLFGEAVERAEVKPNEHFPTRVIR